MDSSTDGSWISSQIHNKEKMWARCWWLTPVILATQEAEIRNSSQDATIKKKPSQKRAGGVSP
jgi:hypothetical protein